MISGTYDFRKIVVALRPAGPILILTRPAKRRTWKRKCTMATAKILSERTAGGLWIEVYEARKGADVLVYSHDYFADGASESQYHDLLAQAKADAESCLTWGDWEGCDHDEDGSVSCPSESLTTFTVAEYARANRASDGLWEIVEDDGKMAHDFLGLLS